MDTAAAVGCFSGKEYRLLLWTSETVQAVWPDVEELFLRDRSWESHYTLEAFRELVTCPNAYVWTFHDEGGLVAALVAQFQDWPSVRVLDLRWMAAVPGNGIKAVQYSLEVIELWAKRMGAARVETTGRPEWAHVLKEYTPQAIVLSKNLNGLTEH